MRERGVDFVRVNMSHSSLDDLRRTIKLAKKVGIPFIVDTEGSQIRTGRVGENRVVFQVGDTVHVYAKSVIGDRSKINITPANIVPQLRQGDILYCDFDSLALNVSDISTLRQKGYVVCRVISGGSLGSNKGVYLDSASGVSVDMPPLTAKDMQSISIGLKEKVGHVAASFMRNAEAVKFVRKVSNGKMKIISKVECIDGLRNLDGIIKESDMLLVDRGDLSKEIFLTRIPFTQKIIVHRARKKKKPVIIATNFLESMVHAQTPTRAEIHDIESSITDGAIGLTLAAETAIGKYPHECINVMKNVINHVTSVIDVDTWSRKEEALVAYLEKQNYLLDFAKHSPLIEPHGGRLVDRVLKEKPATSHLRRLPKIQLTEELAMDVEQIAIGAYSPLEGFMDKKELESVLTRSRLPNGIAWPLPIVLDVSEKDARGLKKGDKVALLGTHKKPIAILHLTEKYSFDKEVMNQKLYNTTSEEHPGVRRVNKLQPILLAGPIDLIERGLSETTALELTPRQTRRLFEMRDWSRVVGFHTRNVVHRSHEFIQMKAIEQVSADGLFVHPVVGKKKAGDFKTQYISESYNRMIRDFYPTNKALFGAFATYSRYAGPKEALFTAIVRQNFGCSHFVVGRDHTGVGDFYHPKASHKIFDQFPELGIKPIRFDKIFFSKKLNEHVHEAEDLKHAASEKLHISGTEARKMFEKGETPPEWFMRPEISKLILDAIKRGEEVFVPPEA
jgi:pyruvate kinase